MTTSATLDNPAHTAGEADENWTPPTWDDLVRDQSSRVFRQALRLTGNTTDAEDLTQDVFVRVFRALPTFRPGTLDGWIHRITQNLFLDQVRRKSKIRMGGLPDYAEERFVLESTVDTPQGAYDHNNFDLDVKKALAELPQAQRTAVVLRDVNGLTYEEIADRLGWKLGTVRSRIHRGRALLRESLAHRDPQANRMETSGAGVKRYNVNAVVTQSR